MYIQILGTTLLVMLIGYIIGSISNSILVSQLLYKKDIRNFGSKNAGSTNIARNYGTKIGLLVLILDFLKPIIAIFLVYLIREKSNDEVWNKLLIQATGLGVVIGHIWPIFFKFKGGKGVACFAGYVLMVNWLIFIISIIAFIIIVKKTQKVSLGSIFFPIVVIILQIIFNFVLNSKIFNPIMNIYPWWINTIFLVIFLIIIILKHVSNIKRIFLGKEPSIKEFKK